MHKCSRGWEDAQDVDEDDSGKEGDCFVLQEKTSHRGLLKVFRKLKIMVIHLMPGELCLFLGARVDASLFGSTRWCESFWEHALIRVFLGARVDASHHYTTSELDLTSVCFSLFLKFKLVSNTNWYSNFTA